MAKKRKKKEEEKVLVSVPMELQRGHYANLTKITHTENEFVFDFLLRISREDISFVSRIVISPKHARALSKTLNNNIEKFEKRFGVIEKIKRVSK